MLVSAASVSYTHLIDMQKETALDKLFVLEYIGPEGTTRGNETTIEAVSYTHLI